MRENLEKVNVYAIVPQSSVSPLLQANGSDVCTNSYRFGQDWFSPFLFFSLLVLVDHHSFFICLLEARHDNQKVIIYTMPTGQTCQFP